ncbi:MAG: Mitochondrial dicarboxylate transporter, partial [Stictis urceolatum]|nr:Mitochondrial dicarboxylate transporter [Stictis urceolata]
MPTSVIGREQRHIKQQQQSVRYPFWFGGSASCFAAIVTHPLDLVKVVRLQTRDSNGPKGMLKTVVHIIKNDGPLGLYSGLSASLLRQATYSTTRFGVYEYLKSIIAQDTGSPSFPVLVAIASTSGFLGGIAGNPADVLNVRMQHDAALPSQSRRNYKNALDGLIRMSREEGLTSLFKGVWPNSMRAVLMTASQLASYDSIKSTILIYTSLPDNLTTHFLASITAGFIATTICSPVDVVKTRIMSAQESESLMQLLSRVYKLEGAGWIFRGWLPSFMRLGPHTVATFLFLEQHKK